MRRAIRGTYGAESGRYEPQLQPSTKFARIGQFGNFVQGVWPTLEALKINDYDPIADVFDAVMGDDFHAATHHIRQNVALSICDERPLRCLDLCCGTGLFFALLSTDLPIIGYGLDRSMREIQIARKRQIGSSGRVDFRVADVIAGEYPPDMHFVTINFDALNHLRGASLWRQLFRRVFRSLVKDGVFLFDINLPERLSNDWNWPEVIFKDDLFYVHIGLPPTFRANTVVRRTPMIVFSKLPDGLFVRSAALIEQFAMPQQDVLELLASVGFRQMEVVVPATTEPIGHVFNKNRAFIMARK
jgi:SAM-dependent methyltransferase